MILIRVFTIRRHHHRTRLTYSITAHSVLLLFILTQWLLVISSLTTTTTTTGVMVEAFSSSIAIPESRPSSITTNIFPKQQNTIRIANNMDEYASLSSSSPWTMKSSSSSFYKMLLPIPTTTTTLSTCPNKIIDRGTFSTQQQQSRMVSTTTRRPRGVLGFQIHHDNNNDVVRRETTTTNRFESSSVRTTTQQNGVQKVSKPQPFRSNVDSTSWNVPEPMSLDVHTAYGRSQTWSKEEEERSLLDASAIKSMTVVELKIQLGMRGLKKTGNKLELQTRLYQWCEQQQQSSSESSSSSVESSSNNHQQPSWKRFERELLSWDIESSTLLKQPTSINEQQQQQYQNQERLRVDSLAEWARTVDLQPLLDRRQAIHREKLQGKKKKNEHSRNPSEKDWLQSLPAEEYRSVLKKVFERSSNSKYSNREVQQMYQAAKHADQAGDRDLSKRLLLELKVATPNDARIYRRLARMEKEDGNVNQARTILREGLARDPNNAFLWHGLAQLEASAGDVVAQKQYLRKAIEVDPSLPHSYHALGTLEHTQGQIANAMKTLKQGIEYCPTNHRLHHALGDLYRDAKMLDMASNSYRKALQYGQHVSHGFAYTALAYVAYEQDRPEECRRWLHRAIQLNDGRHANGWVSLAQFEESEGNIDAARAACMAAISQYERGLRKPCRNIKARQEKQSEESQYQVDDPISSRSDLMRSVPSFRSGDRFFNVYRNWARLEERYGTIETVEEVYERGISAFPHEWKLTLDWAQYLSMLDMKDKARKLYAKSCKIANNRHADPYRQFAEFEMAHGNYDEARKILYSGAMKLLDENDFKSARHGMTELWYTWAVCEWHLGNLSHAETLFRQALSLTSSAEEGSKFKSFILYSMARLEFFRDEYRRSQHYIGLCLKENLMPGGNSKVWDLWAEVAGRMGNGKLAEQCQKHAAQARQQEAESDGDPSGLSRLLAAVGTKTSTLPDMQQLMRRDPWHQKIFGSSGTQFSSVFERLVLPSKKILHHQDEICQNVARKGA